MNDIKWGLIFPNIERLISLLLKDYDYYFNNWWATFSVAMTASVIALSLALVLSVISIRYKTINLISKSLVVASQSFPLQAIAPLIIIVLGVGFFTKTLIAFIIAFFPIYSTCTSALLATPKELIAYSSVCNCSYMLEMWYIRFPSALPTIISSIKVGFTLSVLGSVVAEFIQPDKGLGYVILMAQSNYDTEVIYICIILLIVQGLMIFVSLSALEKAFLIKRGIQS